MISPPEKLLNFIQQYAGRKDLAPIIRRAYIACIESDMTDDWHGDQRAAFYYLIEDLQELIQCLDMLLPDIIPVLKEFAQQYEVKEKESNGSI